MSGHSRAAVDAAGAADPAVTEVARVLREASDVTLLGHLNPDADALGSALALAGGLRAVGCTVRVSFDAPRELPEALLALDREGLIVAPDAVPAAPSTLIACDAGAEHRLGVLADRVSATRAAGGDVVVLDHHVDNTRFGTVHVVDETAEATAIIVLRVLDALRLPLDTNQARCLYAGLVTDSRGFRSAGPAAHRLAARLLEAGVDPAATARELMDSHPYRWIGMLSRVLGRAELERSAVGGLGMVHTTVRLADAEGLRGADVDSVIDVLRGTAEAEVAVVLKETAPNRWMVSLRADSAVDVAHAARACGGGGHHLAAGFTTDGSAGAVLSGLRRALAECPPPP